MFMVLIPLSLFTAIKCMAFISVQGSKNSIQKKNWLHAYKFLLKKNLDAKQQANPLLHTCKFLLKKTLEQDQQMPSNKRILVDDSSSDDETVYVYVLSNKTLQKMPMFVQAFSEPFWQQKDGDEPDEESSTAETFLLKVLCSTPGTLDEEKILDLLKDEKNHLPVMEALECLLGYDLDMQDVESGLQSEQEVAEVRRIVRLLPKWAKIANEERSIAFKKAKSE